VGFANNVIGERLAITAEVMAIGHFQHLRMNYKTKPVAI